MSGDEQPAIRLERGGPRDLDTVAAIMEDAFDERFGEAWTRSQCAGILPISGIVLVIARAGEVAAGFSLYRTIADEAELLLIAVARDYRRRGIGRRLLGDFLDSAREQGVARVHLEVRDGNPASALYEAAGFTCQGRRNRYYKGRSGGEYDAITLQLAL